MTSLAAKYDYFEKLTGKLAYPQNKEPKKRTYVPFQPSTAGEGGPSKKKKKEKPPKGNNQNTNVKKPGSNSTLKPAEKKKRSGVEHADQALVHKGNDVKKQSQSKGSKAGEFNSVDILRVRLHQKIEESRGQGSTKDPTSEEVLKKRAKRKLERERKKRKRKEFRMKKLAESASAETTEIKTEQAPEPEAVTAASKPVGHKKDTSSIVFNKVEVGEEYKDKATKLQDKKKKVKGGLTPLTGRNYKQLLSRVEARKARIEELRMKDEKKALKAEEKMKWTNVLYKAEGLKIKDNEDLLRASLKRKEKQKNQRKKKWADRSQNVLEKMQRRQDKRRRNIQKSKRGKMEKRKQVARKKGRILPEDLKKASLKGE